MFLGNAHDLVAVGIHPCCFGSVLLLVVLEVYGAVMPVAVFALANENLFPGKIIRLLLWAEWELAPVFKPLDGAVGIVPTLVESVLAFVLLRLFVTVVV